MNLNERVKSLFGNTSVKPNFTYVDGISCIQLSNFCGFDRLYINYMEKLEQPMGFSIDGYSKYFERFMNPSLEITALVDKHPEEFEIIRNFFNYVTERDVTDPCRCDTCKDARLIKEIKKRGNVEELRSLVDRLESERDHYHTDRDVTQAHLDGDLPNWEFMKHIWDLQVAYGDDAKTKEVLDKMFGKSVDNSNLPF